MTQSELNKHTKITVGAAIAIVVAVFAAVGWLDARIDEKIDAKVGRMWTVDDESAIQSQMMIHDANPSMPPPDAGRIWKARRP